MHPSALPFSLSMLQPHHTTRPCLPQRTPWRSPLSSCPWRPDRAPIGATVTPATDGCFMFVAHCGAALAGPARTELDGPVAEARQRWSAQGRPRRLLDGAAWICAGAPTLWTGMDPQWHPPHPDSLHRRRHGLGVRAGG